MTLFKLKKDGKTVGYLKIQKGQILFCKAEWNDVEDKWRNWQDVGRNYRMYFDSAHPFVCKDKTGKDVFADDPVWFHWKGKKSEGKVIKDGLFWKYESAEKYSRTLCKFDLSHIELIEEKDD